MSSGPIIITDREFGLLFDRLNAEHQAAEDYLIQLAREVSARKKPSDETGTTGTPEA
jgi:hypothetical protein